MGVLDKDVISGKGRKKQQGYKVSKGEAEKGLKRACVFLSPDVVEFIDDFAYEIKKEKGVKVTTSGLVRSAIRKFAELSRREQINLLED